MARSEKRSSSVGTGRAAAESDPLVEPTLLLDRGSAAAALDQLEALAATFPDDPEVRLTMAMAALKCNRILLACQTFEAFLARWPGHRRSERVRGALEDLRAARESALAALGLGDDDLDVAVMHEDASVLLAAGAFDRARKLAEAVLERRPDCRPARNNLSLLHWLAGDLDGALRQVEQVLQEAPDDPQALCQLTRYFLLSGHPDEARRVAETLRALPDDRGNACLLKMEALTLVGDHAAVASIYEKAVAPGSVEDTSSPVLHHLGAVANARQGRPAAARSLWHQALRADNDFQLAKDNLDDAKAREADRHGAWPYHLSSWMPAADLQELQGRLRGVSAEGLAPAIREFLQAHPGAPTTVRILLERGDPVGRDLGLMLATHAHTPAMDEALKRFALGSDGPDRLRLTALKSLAERGALPDEPVRVRVRGEWREVRADLS